MERRTKTPCLAALLAAAVMASCDYKDLEPGKNINPGESEPVELKFDFARIDSIPASYSIMFYRIDREGYSFRRDVRAKDQVIEVPAGQYAVTAWNNDTPHVLTENHDDRKALRATTIGLDTRTQMDAASVLDSIFAGQLPYDWPDYMTHANVEEFNVEKGAGTPAVLTLRPDSMTVTVHYRIGGIRSLGWCYRVKGAQNNVWGRRYTAYEDKADRPVSVMFESDYDEQAGTVSGEYQIFGLAGGDDPALQARDRMVLFFWLQNGSGGYVPIDITRALDPYRNREVRHIYIDIPDLDIDLIDFLDGDGGFSFDISEWENVNIDIRI